MNPTPARAERVVEVFTAHKHTGERASAYAHEAGHLIALHHYYGPIMHSLKFHPEGATLKYLSPLKDSADHMDGYYLAVATLAGIAAEAHMHGLPKSITPAHTDGQRLEQAWHHYQKHWRGPRIHLPSPRTFLHAAKAEAHALLAMKRDQLEALTNLLADGQRPPDHYYAPDALEEEATSEAEEKLRAALQRARDLEAQGRRHEALALVDQLERVLGLSPEQATLTAAYAWGEGV